MRCLRPGWYLAESRLARQCFKNMVEIQDEAPHDPYSVRLQDGFPNWRNVS